MGNVGIICSMSLTLFVAAVSTPSQAHHGNAPARPLVHLWERIGTRTEAKLTGVAFAADRLTGIAVGMSGTINITSDGGRNWHTPKSGITIGNDLFAVDLAADGRAGWAVGSDGLILLTTNGGENWHAPTHGDSSQETLRAIRLGSDQKSGIAVGTSGTILLTSDGGDNWRSPAEGEKSHITLNGLYLDHDGKSGWAVGDDGTVLTTSDGGEHWKTPNKDSGLNQLRDSADEIDGGWDLKSVYFSSNGKKGWIVGSEQTALLTEDGGAHWRSILSDDDDADYDSDEATDFQSVQFYSDNNIGIALGDDGEILRSTDGGRSWKASVDGPHLRQPLTDVFLSDDGMGGWIVGADGIVLVTHDAGAHWRPDIDGRGTYNRLRAIHFALDNEHGISVGDDSAILLTSDGGKSWRSPSGPNAGQHELADVDLTGDGNHAWAAGNNGAILLTSDGGESWRLPLQPPHIKNNINRVRVAENGQAGCAVGDKGTVLLATDEGETWRATTSKTAQTDLNGLFLSPDGKKAWAVGADGTILLSVDGCEHWHPAAGETGTDDALEDINFDSDLKHGWAVGGSGTILLTEDGGEHWHRDADQIGPHHTLHKVAFASDGLSGLVTGDKGYLLQSRDGGIHWSAPNGGSGTSLELFGADLTSDGSIACAVGDAGVIACGTSIKYAPHIESSDIKSNDDGSVTVLARISDQEGDPLRSAHLAVQGPGVKNWSTPETDSFVKPAVNGGPWTVTWRPSQFPAGVSIAHQAIFDDGGPALLPYPLGSVVWNPWYTQLWHEDREEILSAGGILAAIALYLGFLGLTLLFAPRRLAHWGPSVSLAAATTPPGIIGFGVGLLRSVVQFAGLSWFIRRERVRRAWLTWFRKESETLANLSAFARQHFLKSDDVLDAWIEMHAERVKDALVKLDLYKTRRLFIPSPLRRGEPETAPLMEVPKPDDFRVLFGRARNLISIIGRGGSGKSTLACAIARWAMDDDPAVRPAGHRMLPIFVRDETDDLVASVAGELREIVAPSAELPDDLLVALLARQRLLVVVDALSEYTPATQRHVETIYKKESPINALLITSRYSLNFGTVERTEMFPEPLRGKRLVSFIFDYLLRSKRESAFSDREALSLAERILLLAEGEATDVTPLLAVLFVESAISLQEQGLLNNLPAAVPEIYLHYLKRLNPNNGASEKIVPFDRLEKAVCIAADCSLGRSLTPGDFRRDAAIEQLYDNGFQTQAELVLDRLIQSGIIESRSIAGLSMLRFHLDPAAEYFAAIGKVHKFFADTAAWRDYFISIKIVEGYPSACEGYLTALEVCIRHYRKELQLPELAIPWLN